MPLNLPRSGGDFSPFIRFMASTSSWEMSADGATKAFTFTQAIADIANIRTGWGLMGEGQAPQWKWNAIADKPEPRPAGDGEWKAGISLKFYSPKMFGDEPVRELSSTGTGVCMGLEALYDEYEKSVANNPGKVPVVAFEGAESVKVGKGRTSIPKLKIVKWVDRPAELDSDSDGAPAAAAQPDAAPSAPAGDEEF